MRIRTATSGDRVGLGQISIGSGSIGYVVDLYMYLYRYQMHFGSVQVRIYLGSDRFGSTFKILRCFGYNSGSDIPVIYHPKSQKYTQNLENYSKSEKKFVNQKNKIKNIGNPKTIILNFFKIIHNIHNSGNSSIDSVRVLSNTYEYQIFYLVNDLLYIRNQSSTDGYFGSIWFKFLDMG